MSASRSARLQAVARAEKAELEALAAAEGDRLPDWHVQVLSDRENESGGESWESVEARILDGLQRRASPA